MTKEIKYYEFDLIKTDKNGNYYKFQNEIIFDCKRRKIKIPEELISQNNINKGKNISENINRPNGLINNGHYCSINALLQCLINCVPMTNYFLTKYKATHNNILSNCYLDFIQKYQKKDVYAAKNIINYFLSYDSTIKSAGSDSKDVLFEFFDRIQSELKQSEASIIVEESTNPEIEKEIIGERINLDRADYSIIYECFNFWIINERKCCYNMYCPKFNINLYEIRSESYFVFYLSDIYSKKLYSRRRNGNNNKLSLEDCFYYYFLEEGSCAYCNNKIDIKNKICKLPNILIIVLNRGKNNHFNVNIEFHQELNLKECYQQLKYNIDELNYENCPNYNLLCGTILEKNYYNPGKGHTIAFANDYKGKYNIYDDNRVAINVDFQDIKNKDVYIIFYQMKKSNNKTLKMNNI